MAPHTIPAHCELALDRWLLPGDDPAQPNLLGDDTVSADQVREATAQYAAAIASR